jgi:hypothetical protein
MVTAEVSTLARWSDATIASTSSTPAGLVWIKARADANRVGG